MRANIDHQIIRPLFALVLAAMLLATLALISARAVPLTAGILGLVVLPYILMPWKSRPWFVLLVQALAFCLLLSGVAYSFHALGCWVIDRVPAIWVVGAIAPTPNCTQASMMTTGLMTLFVSSLAGVLQLITIFLHHR